MRLNRIEEVRSIEVRYEDAVDLICELARLAGVTYLDQIPNPGRL
jgi:hypothetical protein